jgi:hypothetical protein
VIVRALVHHAHAELDSPEGALLEQGDEIFYPDWHGA